MQEIRAERCGAADAILRLSHKEFGRKDQLDPYLFLSPRRKSLAAVSLSSDIDPEGPLSQSRRSRCSNFGFNLGVEMTPDMGFSLSVNIPTVAAFPYEPNARTELEMLVNVYSTSLYKRILGSITPALDESALPK